MVVLLIILIWNVMFDVLVVVSVGMSVVGLFTFK